MPSTLTFRKILKFWFPLSITWLMMSVEGPYLAAIIARMPLAKINLAAYGVSFSFAMIVEAPIIMMMSASVALIKDSQSFNKLKIFAYSLNVLITVIMILFVIPPVFYYISDNLIKLPPDVARITHIATIMLIPWPASIGYRRFYQGILINHNLTRRVAYGTVVRLGTMSVTALVLWSFTHLEGALVGAAALSAGVISEAVASRIMALSIVKKIRTKQSDTGNPLLSHKAIFNFYYPLALTSILTLAVNPMITFFMGQSRLPVESLAVLPVINSFVFIFKSLGISFQETAIALIGEKKREYISLRNFAVFLGAITTVALVLVAFLPLSDLWFTGVSGLSEELASLTRIPLIILAITPGLEVLISFQRAMIVDSRITKYITTATGIEVGGILLVLYITIGWFSFIGVTAASLAMLIGRIGANIYLHPPFKQSIK